MYKYKIGDKVFINSSYYGLVNIIAKIEDIDEDSTFPFQCLGWQFTKDEIKPIINPNDILKEIL